MTTEAWKERIAATTLLKRSGYLVIGPEDAKAMLAQAEFICQSKHLTGTHSYALAQKLIRLAEDSP